MSDDDNGMPSEATAAVVSLMSDAAVEAMATNTTDVVVILVAGCECISIHTTIGSDIILRGVIAKAQDEAGIIGGCAIGGNGHGDDDDDGIDTVEKLVRNKDSN